MSVITVPLEDDLERWLDSVAQRSKSSKTSLIKNILKLYREDYEDAEIALERMNRNDSRYLSTEELEAELGL